MLSIINNSSIFFIILISISNGFNYHKKWLQSSRYYPIASSTIKKIGPSDWTTYIRLQTYSIKFILKNVKKGGIETAYSNTTSKTEEMQGNTHRLIVTNTSLRPSIKKKQGKYQPSNIEMSLLNQTSISMKYYFIFVLRSTKKNLNGYWSMMTILWFYSLTSEFAVHNTVKRSFTCSEIQSW